MNKQEFLAMNLPHKLKVAEFNDDGKIIRIEEIYSGRYNAYCLLNYYKSICRPLPDLTKPITQANYNNGKPFIPIDELKNAIGIRNWCEAYDNALEILFDNVYSARVCELIERLPYQFVEHFIKWHFAVGLQDWEYIDVNTLPENPYK